MSKPRGYMASPAPVISGKILVIGGSEIPLAGVAENEAYVTGEKNQIEVLPQEKLIHTWGKIKNSN